MPVSPLSHWSCFYFLNLKPYDTILDSFCSELSLTTSHPRPAYLCRFLEERVRSHRMRGKDRFVNSASVHGVINDPDKLSVRAVGHAEAHDMIGETAAPHPLRRPLSDFNPSLVIPYRQPQVQLLQLHQSHVYLKRWRGVAWDRRTCTMKHPGLVHLG